MITIELTEEEYKSVFTALKFCSHDEMNYSTLWKEHYSTINIVLLKMMKSKYPEHLSNIGPW